MFKNLITSIENHKNSILMSSIGIGALAVFVLIITDTIPLISLITALPMMK